MLWSHWLRGAVRICFSMGCQVRLSMNPPSLLKLLGCSISVASFTRRSMYPSVLTSLYRSVSLNFIHFTTLMMETVSETSDFITLLTRLSARENFIEFCRRESFKTYISAFAWRQRKTKQTCIEMADRRPSGCTLTSSRQCWHVCRCCITCSLTTPVAP